MASHSRADHRDICSHVHGRVNGGSDVPCRSAQLDRALRSTAVKRTEKFGGSGFQDWMFRMEMAVKLCSGKLHSLME